jgi:hypothetical protein
LSSIAEHKGRREIRMEERRSKDRAENTEGENTEGENAEGENVEGKWHCKIIQCNCFLLNTDTPYPEFTFPVCVPKSSFLSAPERQEK